MQSYGTNEPRGLMGGGGVLSYNNNNNNLFSFVYMSRQQLRFFGTPINFSGTPGNVIFYNDCSPVPLI